jgi:hypothetical protein
MFLQAIMEPSAELEESLAVVEDLVTLATVAQLASSAAAAAQVLLIPILGTTATEEPGGLAVAVEGRVLHRLEAEDLVVAEAGRASTQDGVDLVPLAALEDMITITIAVPAEAVAPLALLCLSEQTMAPL